MIDWGEKLKKMGILWQHDCNPATPHALWTSGRHADTFNNGSKLVENPNIMVQVAEGLIDKMKNDLSINKPDWIVGPAFGAVTIAYEIAKQLEIKFAFTEPVQIGANKEQVLRRFDIKEGEKVLVVEDAISTGDSILKTIKTLEDKGVSVLPFVASIVNWSESNKLGKRKINSLFSASIKSWTKNECELCKMGSKVFRPKANWSKFKKIT